MEKYAVGRIENCWCCYKNRHMFKLLKEAISTADHSFTSDVMQKISPQEAELLKDPVFKSKIRFRFSGAEFPPRIVFKVFIQTDGYGVKYLCGKKVIKPASQAASDSCSMMGNRRFLNQILQDMCLEEQYGIQNETEISNMKEYMKYISSMDETSPEAGGRSNTWRTLTLDVVPRHHIISDVLVYLQHRTKTQNLSEFSSKLHRKQPSPSLPLSQTQQTEYIKLLQKRKNNQSGRRSKQSKERVSKMKKIYREIEENETPLPVSPPEDYNNWIDEEDNNLPPLSPLVRNEEIDFEDDLWEEEGKMLFEWTRNLAFADDT